MSVYKPKGRRTYVFDFWYAGVHHKGNTFQEDLERAKLVEAKKKLALREHRGGIAPPAPAPAFSDWAATFYEHLEKQQKRTGRPKRLDRIDELLRVVLRFWGAKPTDPTSPVMPAAGEEAPFHNLTLQDPIDQPTWILEFDDWIDRRGVSGGTRNHYISTLSTMYRLASSALFTKTTGISTNPFEKHPRGQRITRKVALRPPQILAWLSAMSYHARLAVSIAALAPKLRLQNVLTLDRAENIDPDVTRITIWNHKTDMITGEPLIVPITDQLRVILLDAFDRMAPRSTRVVQYRGKPVKSIRFSIAAAARDVGIQYGRFAKDGVTFHTLRHSAATIIGRLGISPLLGRDTIGQRDLESFDGYVHLQLEEQRPVLEQLSQQLPIADIVTAPRRRVQRKHKGRTWGELKGPLAETARKSEETRAPVRASLKTRARQFARKS